MLPVEGSRPYDLVLFGATGFTGGLTADYLAAHAPATMRWAIAGRNRSKLDAVAARLAAAAPEAPKPDVIVADAADREALSQAAESTRVVITTIGPYALHGEPLVAACAASAPTTSTSPASPSSSTGSGSTTTPRRSAAAPASSTAAASTRSRTTSVPTSPSSSCPKGCR